MSIRKATPSVKTAQSASSRAPLPVAPNPPAAPKKKAADLYVQFGHLVTTRRTVTIKDFRDAATLGGGTIKLPPRGPGPLPSREFVEVFEVDVPDAGVVVEVGIRFRPR